LSHNFEAKADVPLLLISVTCKSTAAEQRAEVDQLLTYLLTGKEVVKVAKWSVSKEEPALQHIPV